MREKYLEELLVSTIIGGVAAHLISGLLPYMQEAGIMTTVTFLVFWILGITVTWHTISLAQWIRKRASEK